MRGGAGTGTHMCVPYGGAAFGPPAGGTPALPGSILMHAQAHPLAMGPRVDLALPEGPCLADMLRAAGMDPALPALVCIGGWGIPREHWERVRPRAGQVVTVRALAAGGSGGGGKNITRMILSIAVMAAAAIAAPYLAAAIAPALMAAGGVGAAALTAGIQAGIGLVGTLVINALIPPPEPPSQAQADSEAHALAPPSNRIDPWGVVPRVIGRVRITPPMMCYPYTELAPEALNPPLSPVELEVHDQWVYAVVGLAGPVHVEEILLDETPIGDHQDVEWHVLQGLPGDPAPGDWLAGLGWDHIVHEREPSPGGLLLEQEQGDDQGPLPPDAGWYIRDVPEPADRIELDIHFHGLYLRNDDGTHGIGTPIEAQWAPAGTDAWTHAGTWHPAAKHEDLTRFTLRFDLPAPQAVRLRVRRAVGNREHSDATIADEPRWAITRTFRWRRPIETSRSLTLVYVKAKAQKGLTGRMPAIRLWCSSILNDWTGSAWQLQATRNPAAAWLSVLQHAATGAGLPDARIDWGRIQAWADYCTARGWEASAILDGEGTVWQRLQRIAGLARAHPLVRDGRLSVVIDEYQPVPVQVFTGRNLRPGLRWKKVFQHTPHALRVLFTNRYLGVRDEVVVYADGHDATSASRYEAMEIDAWLGRAQAHELGLYEMAQARLRPDTGWLPCDIEAVVCEPGDRVLVQHDAIPVGLVAGRVKAIAGGTITLDEIVEMEAGVSYGLLCRLGDGATVTVPIAGGDGGTYTVTPTGGVPAGLQPADLVVVGELGIETRDLVVKSIRAEEDLSATLEVVAAALDIHDPMPVPDYDDDLPPGSGGTPGDQVLIPSPVLTVAGALITWPIDGLDEPAWRLTASWTGWAGADYHRVRIVHPDGRVEDRDLAPGETSAVIEPGQAGTYTIMAWAVDAQGREGPPGIVTWTAGPLPPLAPAVTAATAHVHVAVLAPRYALPSHMVLMAAGVDDPAAAVQVDIAAVDAPGPDVPGRRVELTHSGAGALQYYWVWARQRLGDRGGSTVDGPWVGPVSAVPTGGQAAAVTELAAWGSVRAVDVTCRVPAAPAIQAVLVYGSDTDLWADAAQVDEAVVGPDLIVSLRDVGLGDEVTRWYWARTRLVGGGDGPLVGPVSAVTVVPLPTGTPGACAELVATGGYGHVRLSVTAPASPDLVVLEMQAATDQAFSNVVATDSKTVRAGSSAVLVDRDVPWATGRWYRVRARSLQGTPGPWTAAVAAVALAEPVMEAPAPYVPPTPFDGLPGVVEDLTVAAVSPYCLVARATAPAGEPGVMLMRLVIAGEGYGGGGGGGPPLEAWHTPDVTGQTVGPDYVYGVDTAWRLVAVRQSDGSLAMESGVNYGTPRYVSPTGEVYAQDGEVSYLYIRRISPDLQTVLMETTLPFGSLYCLTADPSGGIYYAGAGNGKKISKMNADGSPSWEKSYSGLHYPWAAVGPDGRVYVAASDGLYCYDTNGTLIYHSAVALGATGISVGPNEIYVPDYNGRKLTLFDLSGAEQWTVSTGGNTLQPVVLADDGGAIFSIRVSSSEYYAVKRSREDGAEQWRFVPYSIGAQPAMIGGSGTHFYLRAGGETRAFGEPAPSMGDAVPVHCDLTMAGEPVARVAAGLTPDSKYWCWMEPVALDGTPGTAAGPVETWTPAEAWP